MNLPRPPLFSVFLLSATTLAYEILLMRLFSIIQWHHFAYMIISLALLGYGISGSILAVFRHWLIPRFRSAYIIAIVLFSVSTIICFLIAQAIPFNAEEALWNIQQPFYLLTIFLLLSLPFFFAASAICLNFMAYQDNIAKIYAVDLSGAGVGSLGIVFMLYLVFPFTALLMIMVSGLVTAILACWELQVARRYWLTAGLMILIAVLWSISSLSQLNISPYKGLSQLLQISGAEIITERSSPLGKLSVVESKQIPLRHAPGLSLNATTEPLLQLGVFTDADNMTVINQAPTQKAQFAYLDQVTWALPYHLKKPAKVLLVGVGGGTEILQAQYHDIQQIDAVELNPQLIKLVQEDFGDFSGNLYSQKNVKIHISEVRDYLSRNQHQYNLIQLALIDAFNASTSGLYALNENYLYTTEALKLYLRNVSPQGYLAITRWIKIPPRDTLKLFVTAVDALRENGVTTPEKQLVLIRSWQTSTLLIKNGTFTAGELKAVRQFCIDRSFDIAYAPDININEVNRYNILKSATFYHAAKSFLGDKKAEFIDQYKFNLEPATDDRPYFHQFFKWSVLPEILELRGKGGIPLLEWGYLILIATLLMAITLSLLLIIFPLYFIRQEQGDVTQLNRWRIGLFFFTVGIAFMLIEMAFIQKFIQFLHHPLYAVAVVLTAFLICAGFGSHWSERLLAAQGYLKAIITAVLGIVVISVVYLLLLEQVFSFFSATATVGKIIVSLCLIAPLAFFMGMPFPLALNMVSRHAAALVPWAWGINGCASVISAVLATILAVHLGFTTVILIALVFYLLLIAVLPIPVSRRSNR